MTDILLLIHHFAFITSFRGRSVSRNRILLVDDDEDICFALRKFLTARGYEVIAAGTCRAAEEAFAAGQPDVAVIDYALPDGSALELLARLREIDSSVPLVVLTAHGSIDLAVRAIKEGAEQFLTKPIELPALLVVLQRLLETERGRKKLLAHALHDARDAVDPFRGTSRAIRELAEHARSVLASHSPLLIEGETGTGKSVLARWIHAHGPRADEPFVDLNCASFSRELLESELFGHEKGAFTGAIAAKPGLLEVAHRGTVFLDEIGDMDLQVQPKLLKVLEEKRFRKVGGVRDRQVDIRLITATHQDLNRLALVKQFRSDFYFRISALPLHVPPLRQRAEDIPALAGHLLKSLAAELKHEEITLAPDALATLHAYSWPGNIRELRNVLERAVLLAGSPVISRRDLRFGVSPGHPATTTEDDADATLESNERRHIERILHEQGGRVDHAAACLGLSRSALYKKISKHCIDLPK